jgi:hypothetical protein
MDKLATPLPSFYVRWPKFYSKILEERKKKGNNKKADTTEVVDIFTPPPPPVSVTVPETSVTSQTEPKGARRRQQRKQEPMVRLGDASPVSYSCAIEAFSPVPEASTWAIEGGGDWGWSEGK